MLTSRGRPRVGDLVQLAHALKETGDEESALSAYRRAAERFPADLDAQRQLGLFLRRVGRNIEAADHFARASILFPDTSDIIRQLHDLSGEESEELDVFYLRGILRGSDIFSDGGGCVSPSRAIARHFVRRGAARSRERDWTGAEHWYRRAIAVVPAHLGALVQLGHAIREQGRPEEAVFLYRRALAFSPRRSDPYIHLGHALKALNRRESAFSAYLTAWRLNPSLTEMVGEMASVRGGVTESILEDDVYGRVIVHRSDANPREPNTIGRQQLAEEQWLSASQRQVFKFFSGSLALKD